MQKDKTNDQINQAEQFFAKAGEIAKTRNYDYAIELYIEGLRRYPDALEKGHIPLHELGLSRRSNGGKKPSMMEKVKLARVKDPSEQFIVATYLFAKDPEHLPYAEVMLKAGVRAGHKRTAKWIADFIFDANNAAAKPSFNTYMLLKDAYESIGQMKKAVAACHRALEMKPEDDDLMREFQRISAELTVSLGKYDEEGDFTKSIKNRKQQDELHARDGVVKSDDYQQSVINQARREFQNDPDMGKNIFNLASALSSTERDKEESEAIEILENAYNRQNDFSYKQKAGEIKLRQLRRHIRNLGAQLKKDPQNEENKKRLERITKQLNEAELGHFRLCAENYPTDAKLKFEYASRLVDSGRVDEAIPLFQEAQRDPRLKIRAMGKIGLCFFAKKWASDAIDIFEQAIEAYEIKDDSLAKELRYNLARAYEMTDKADQALEIYRKIAQIDFAYKDVKDRIEKLRQSLGI